MRPRDAAAVLGALALAGCGASTEAPRGALPGAGDLDRDAWGAWVEIEPTWPVPDPDVVLPVSGELIAIDAEAIWVLPDGSAERGLAEAVPRAAAGKIRLEKHASGKPVAVGWMFAGILSTISHGAFLIVSVPMWAVIGGVASSSAGREPILQDAGAGGIAPWARFPAGPPPGLAELELRRRPRPAP